MKARPLRIYIMALMGTRRIPIRVPKARIADISEHAREWWRVEARSAIDARKLCLAWPHHTRDAETEAKILAHWRVRK